MGIDDAIAHRLAQMAPLRVPDGYAHRVVHWIDILEEHAKIFNAISLPAETEPASVFQA